MSDREDELKRTSKLEAIGRNLTYPDSHERKSQIYEQKEIVSEQQKGRRRL